MKRDIIYIVHVGYYEFKFYNPRNALSFAQEAMQTTIEEGGVKVRIELQWEEEEESAEVDTEDVIDIDSLNLDGGDTE